MPWCTISHIMKDLPDRKVISKLKKHTKQDWVLKGLFLREAKEMMC